ncbi:MAG: hypothetical protein HN849_22650, partial [Victivallales bacterium]|nr:hypothetical protein [Victivallales bacterium]
MANPGAVAKTPRALRADLRSGWRPADGMVRLTTADQPVVVRMALPAFAPAPGELVVMRFRSRMVSSGFGGWNNFLCLELNGKPVASYTSGGEPRLLNRRGNAMKTSSPKWPNEAYFKRVDGSRPALLTVFGPDWDIIEPRFIADRDELYWFLLDVTDLVRADG